MVFVLAASAAVQAKKVDFHEFAGDYRGTFTLNVPPSVFSGTVDVAVTVSPNGKRMNIRTVGYVLDPSSGNLLSFLGDVALTSSRTISATNLLFAFAAQIPATGSFSVKKQTFTLTMFGTVAGESLVGNYVLRFRNRSLRVNGIAASAGNPPFTVAIAARRR